MGEYFVLSFYMLICFCENSEKTWLRYMGKGPLILYVDYYKGGINLNRHMHSQLNWAILICDDIPDGKTEKTAQFWQAITQASHLSFPVVFHTQNCAVHSGKPTVSSVYLPRPRWHHLKAHPFLAIHSADQHRMIYSFSNTTSYSTFYAFFPSFRITLWPMWLANSKRQPCFYPPQSHTQEDTQNWQKNWQTWWETCVVPQNIQFSFSCIILHI
jgi:hypothetical protein